MGHWKGELRHRPTKSCRQVGGSCPPLPPPASLGQGLPLALVPTAHCSSSFPVTQNGHEGAEIFDW